MEELISRTHTQTIKKYKAEQHSSRSIQIVCVFISFAVVLRDIFFISIQILN